MPQLLTRPREISLDSYARLRDQVRETLLHGQARIEREKVKTYWETGQLIKEHLLANKDRADYGKKLVTRLSKDLDVEQTNLWRAIQFYGRFPILGRRRELPPLSWTHYRALIAVSDEKLRAELASRATDSDWTAGELRAKIKKELRHENGRDLSTAEKSHAPLKPKLGKLYTYRIVQPEDIGVGKGVSFIDQGFVTYRHLQDQKKFKAGDIVESVREGGTYKLVKSSRAESDLFTYKAYVERVVDGDTLRVKLDLGFDEWTRQYIRLRGLDAPEIDTEEGKRARDFVKRQISQANETHAERTSKFSRVALEAQASSVILQSTRSDKYDRYLADVFYTFNGEQKFLNNELLEKKLAVRM